MPDGRFEIAYDLVRDAPSAVTWGWYREWLDEAWQRVLETSDPNDEKVFHRFLETHPCLIPGGDGTERSIGGHHGGFIDAVYTEALLPETSKRFPDFMWLTKNSEQIIPVFVELEAPGKTIWTSKGKPRATYTQALHQVQEWQRLLENPATRLKWGEFYRLETGWTSEFEFSPRFLIIYGRRFEKEERRTSRRPAPVTRAIGQETMSWDRLRPLEGSRNSVTVRQGTCGRPVVIAIQPTLELGPMFASTLAAVDGWEDAIGRCEALSDARRGFLLSRLEYWREWARAGGGILRTGDRE